MRSEATTTATVVTAGRLSAPLHRHGTGRGTKTSDSNMWTPMRKFPQRVTTPFVSKKRKLKDLCCLALALLSFGRESVNFVFSPFGKCIYVRTINVKCKHAVLCVCTGISTSLAISTAGLFRDRKRCLESLPSPVATSGEPW